MLRLMLLLCLVCLPFSATAYVLNGGAQSSIRQGCSRNEGQSSAVGRLNSRRLEASLSRSFDDDLYAPSSALSSMEEDLIRQAQELQQSTKVLIQRNRLKKAFGLLNDVVEKLDAVQHNEPIRLALSEVVDDIVQSLCRKAFRGTSPRYDNVIQAVFALQLQLSCDKKLSEPYRTVPKRTLASALTALTSVNEVQGRQSFVLRGSAASSVATKLSFRILQRLITGVGVRPDKDKYQTKVHEREINQVLNVFSNLGRMDMAHRIVALQERTRHAPPLSPVAYSILLKGYGRQGDLGQVQQVLRQANKNKIKPDVVLLNTLMDAYINCNDVAKARAVFDQMTSESVSADRSSIFRGHALPRPNRRSYNIMLKGFANAGAYNEAIKLSDQMGESQNWDPVTTNTLVRAAVIARKFDAAERLLAKYTLYPSDVDPSASNPHPNVEAYTHLLDAHAKAGDMNKALSVMQTMGQRSVQPNIWTYTCLVAGFGRNQQLGEAKKMLAFMVQKDCPPSTVTYNALMTGLIEGAKQQNASEDDANSLGIDLAVDQSLALLRDLMTNGIRPNSATATLLVDALGRCDPPRIEPASLLVDTLEKKRLIPTGDVQVITALIRVCGMAGNMKRAVKYFRRLKSPDLVAINAFLDTCQRCEQHNLAMDTFNYYFLGKYKSLAPDVITYSVLIGSVLKNGDVGGLREAQILYSDMKRKWRICPDTGMIDMLLKAAIVVARKTSLAKRDVSFVARIIRDAERLTWQEGQLERRKHAVRSILGDRLRDAFLDEQRLGSLSQPDDDELLKKKGWNKVDSGFRLWGQSSGDLGVGTSRQQEPVDQFLESHGWNNVDSGFRIL